MEPKLFETWSGAGAEIIVLIFPIVSLEDARMKKTLYCFSRVLSVNIWQELESEPKLWTNVKPESGPKINNFGYATLK